MNEGESSGPPQRGHGSFATTRWSLVAVAGIAQAADASRALNEQGGRRRISEEHLRCGRFPIGRRQLGKA
jgi:hypothetical protein